MGIQRIKLGPRSRVLEAQEQAACPYKVEPDTVAYPPLPGPANPTSLRGCGCGRVHVTDGDVELDGVTHRYSKPCYRVLEDGQRQYHDLAPGSSVLARLAALERIVEEFLRKGTP